MDLRNSPLDGRLLCRWHVLAGATWSLVAATLGLLLAVQLALGRSFELGAFGVGRLSAAYGHTLLFGAVSLPLAGALLLVGGLPTATASARQRIAAALALWNLGVVFGLVGILAGWRGPEPMLAAPAIATALLAIAALLWAAEVWRMARARAAPLPVAMWFAVAANAGLVTYLGLALLTRALSGASQSLAAALVARGLPALWGAVAGLGVAAAVLPATLGRPLFGRRTTLYGLVSWLFVAGLAAPRDMAPELLPSWLLGPVAGATVLLLIPAVLLGAALLGTFVGTAAGDLDGTVGFLTAGTLFLLAGVVADAATAGEARSLVQFTAWDPAASLLPPLAGLGLLAVGAGYAALSATGALVGSVPVRRHLALAVAAAVLLVAPAWPLGLAEATGGAGLWLDGGFGGAFLGTAFRLRLLGLLLAWATAAVWAANCWADAGDADSGRLSTTWRAWTGGSVGAPSAVSLMALTMVALVVGLLVGLFAPLADPAAVTATARTVARDVVAANRARGRAVYIREGCVACHTQRVRAVSADGPYGPPTHRGDYSAGPSLVGLRRAGPDLAWVGDRYPDRQQLLARLAVHAPGGRPAFAHLFGPGGPTADGADVIDYLVGLQSGPAGQ